MRTELVTEALDMAARNQPDRLSDTIFHSDRGSVSASAEFGQVAKKLNIRQSMGRTSVCWDTAWAESFNGTLKNERCNRTHYPTKEKAIRELPHSFLDHRGSDSINALTERIIGMSSSRSKYSPEFRAEAVREVIDKSRAVADVVRELALAPQTLANRVAAYRRANTEGEEELTVADRTRITELERRVRELEEENRFLGKASAFFESRRITNYSHGPENVGRLT
ncbi:hypothetical protein C5E08_13465 [Rathayibacter iranicus]|uniref:Transposase n=3 Tax=Rathayibacter iranicus TaxID=59737 RepID=A0AAD1AGT8_9MICO|nr:hypothetical protein C7V51_13700 [Rathayibacter iranicus]MWV31993.1 DDE-type integrase/transposase/recombinase [Rathayibacter iranicus NCPPB 2253 = VKM Ac-1602]PPI42870.1 hypothetical protein C5E09_12550 [Rathayibacter iranicus]PPI58134.1 hypothetical protein C5E08_13465 [Rathayibacter iranicus]PPI69030.1 hypothetical protein C5E01_12510 [Rathayibacter iranicus]